MDKNKFIEIYNDLLDNKISIENVIIVIEEYCKINKKDDKMISILIDLLLLNPPSLNHCFTVSLKELSKYFKVTIITNLKTHKIIKVL